MHWELFFYGDTLVDASTSLRGNGENIAHLYTIIKLIQTMIESKKYKTQNELKELLWMFSISLMMVHGGTTTSNNSLSDLKKNSQN